MIMDYLPCLCKIPIQNSFWIYKLYLLEILDQGSDNKILFLSSKKTIIISENSVSDIRFYTLSVEILKDIHFLLFYFSFKMLLYTLFQEYFLITFESLVLRGS